MVDYSDIGLNSLLQKTGSLLDIQGSTITAYSLDSSSGEAIVTNYMLRDASIDKAKIVSLSADQIDAGTVNVQLLLGGANIKIDGSAKQIIVNDGTTDRILIGYGSGLF